MHLHDDTLNTAGTVGLPVLAFGEFFLVVGQIVPPAQFLEQHMVEFRITHLQISALGG